VNFIEERAKKSHFIRMQEFFAGLVWYICPTRVYVESGVPVYDTMSGVGE
jgi:hypothetical protein